MTMNMESLDRIKEAKKYQKMALRALLPESAGEHLEIIEKEFSAMMKECCMEFIKQEASKMAREQSQSTDSSSNGETQKKAKKVVIN